MIVGVTSLPCSGADTFGKILVANGFEWLSYSDLLREELTRQGKEVTRPAMQGLANSWRKEHGTSYLSKKLIAKMQPGKHYVIGTLRNPGEVAELQTLHDFSLVRIVSDAKTRFERMKSRARERDPTTFEEFLDLEKQEQGENQGSHGLQLKETMALAHHEIVNDGSLKEFRILAESFIDGL